MRFFIVVFFALSAALTAQAGESPLTDLLKRYPALSRAASIGGKEQREIDAQEYLRLVENSGWSYRVITVARTKGETYTVSVAETVPGKPETVHRATFTLNESAYAKQMEKIVNTGLFDRSLKTELVQVVDGTTMFVEWHNRSESRWFFRNSVDITNKSPERLVIEAFDAIQDVGKSQSNGDRSQQPTK